MIDVTKKKNIDHNSELCISTMEKYVEWQGTLKNYPYAFKLIHKIGSNEIIIN